MVFLQDELQRAEQLEIPYVVTHLGSHLGAGEQHGRERIVNAINDSFAKVSNSVRLLLENTAGTKNSMGSSFEQIARIISEIPIKRRIGVCFDTAHAFAAGYELRTEKTLTATLNKFDDVIGFNRLYLVHLNDSKGALGSRIDRHEHIGLGRIGKEGFKNILTSKLREYPLILETPINQVRDNEENLQMVRELASIP
jgi:deoxyribonuclease-4